MLSSHGHNCEIRKKSFLWCKVFCLQQNRKNWRHSSFEKWNQISWCFKFKTNQVPVQFTAALLPYFSENLHASNLVEIKVHCNMYELFLVKGDILSSVFSRQNLKGYWKWSGRDCATSPFKGWTEPTR